MENETRYGYHNTSSTAGKPNKIVFNPQDVISANTWTNLYGNPTTMLYFKDGSTFLCEDDYGALNGLNHISAQFVSRKKDL